MLGASPLSALPLSALFAAASAAAEAVAPSLFLEGQAPAGIALSVMAVGVAFVVASNAPSMPSLLGSSPATRLLGRQTPAIQLITRGSA